MTTKETTRNVLVSVDVQNDFIDGSLAVQDGEAVVDPLNNVADAIRSSGGQVVLTRDYHPESTPHFDTWPVHCVAGTEGARFHHELAIEPSDIILSKGMEQTDGYSGWEGVAESGATLESLIEPSTRREKVRVFIGGLATDYCVKATALDVADRFSNDERVELYLLRDAIRAVNIQPEDGQNAVEAMRDARLVAITCEEAQNLVMEQLS